MILGQPYLDGESLLSESGAYRTMHRIWRQVGTKSFLLPKEQGWSTHRVKCFGHWENHAIEHYGTLEEFIANFIKLNKLEDL